MASSQLSAGGDQLDARIQALPQELQDLLFEHYMQLLLTGNIVIGKTYKPPVQLQINKKTREEAIAVYYNHPQIFTLSLRRMKPWLRSLSDEAQDAICEIRRPIDTHLTDLELRVGVRRAVKIFQKLHWSLLRDPRLSSQFHKIKIKVLYYNDDDKEWCSQWLNENEVSSRWLEEKHAVRTGAEWPEWDGEDVRTVSD